MIRTFTTIIIAVFTVVQGYCQIDSLNFGSEPIDGINKLVLEYYKIDFTKEQREKLQDIEIELIFSIDKIGVPTLEEINGVNEKAILDSLQQITNKISRFYPRTVNGIKESSLYFLKFQFPRYRITEDRIGFQNASRYKETDYEDFEYIYKSGERMDVLIGAVSNSFLGNPSKYLNTGGGMKIDVMFVGKGGIGGGLLMGFYGNRLKQNYPILSGREQNSAPPTLMLGLGLNKALIKKERRELNVQLELNYAIQNVTPKLGDSDDDWTQLNGFSPGIVSNYLIQIGKNKSY